MRRTMLLFNLIQSMRLFNRVLYIFRYIVCKNMACSTRSSNLFIIPIRLFQESFRGSSGSGKINYIYDMYAYAYVFEN